MVLARPAPARPWWVQAGREGTALAGEERSDRRLAPGAGPEGPQAGGYGPRVGAAIPMACVAALLSRRAVVVAEVRTSERPPLLLQQQSPEPLHPRARVLRPPSRAPLRSARLFPPPPVLRTTVALAAAVATARRYPRRRPPKPPGPSPPANAVYARVADCCSRRHARRSGSSHPGLPVVLRAHPRAR